MREKSDLKDSLKKGTLGIALFFALIASFLLYFPIDYAVRIWFEYQYIPFLRAMYNIVALLVALSSFSIFLFLFSSSSFS